MLAGRSEEPFWRRGSAAAGSGFRGLSSFDNVRLSSESNGVFMIFADRML